MSFGCCGFAGGIILEHERQQRIVMAARSWIGVRWKHQGRSREGIDCAGLVIKVAHELGISEFDTTEYLRQAVDESMLGLCREHLIEVPRNEALPGDIAVMRFGRDRHIGIFGDYEHGGLSLIHAFSRDPKRVTEHHFSAQWLRSYKAQLIACFRFPGAPA